MDSRFRDNGVWMPALVGMGMINLLNFAHATMYMRLVLVPAYTASIALIS